MKILALIVAMLTAVAFDCRDAFAHTMTLTECHSFAWDVKQSAADRDAGATYKMQVESLPGLLNACRAANPIACAYKDESDDAQALTALGWIYGDAKAAAMTPKAIHDKVEQDCNDKLMEKLREVHGK